MGTLRCCRDYCRKYFLTTTVVVTEIRLEKLKVEDFNSIYQVGTAIYHEDSEQNIAMLSPEDYRDGRMLSITIELSPS